MKILSKAIALGLVLAATPVGAQDADSYGTTDDTGSFGNLDSGDTFSVNTIGAVTRAGQAGAMFDAGEHGIGEAGASSEGEDQVDFSIHLNTCSENCADNKVEGMLTGRQQNQSYSWAKGDQSGVPALASTFGQSAFVGEIAVGVDTCATGCEANNAIGNEH